MENVQIDLTKNIELPSLPIVVQKLHELMDNPDANINEIATIAETDQAFVARMLRLVNSPFYGFQRKIISVDEAITILGFSTVHQLLLTTSLVSSFNVETDKFDISVFWRHSFGVGVFAKELLRKYSKDLRNEAFMCGILHDIGRLVFLKYDPQKFVSFYINGNSVNDLNRETEYFGYNHQEVGQALAQKWNFPESISSAIAHHHTPLNGSEHILLSSAVNIADLICHTMRIGDSGNNFISDFYPEVWSKLDLSMDELEECINNAITATEKSEEILKEL